MEDEDYYICFKEVTCKEVISNLGDCHWENEDDPVFTQYWKLKVNNEIEVTLLWTETDRLCVWCKKEDINEAYEAFQVFHEKPTNKYDLESGWLYLNQE